jgi:hypothetical protein
MLIKESTLRKIIREEARRALHEDAVGLDLVRQAHNASFTKQLPDGRTVQAVGGRSPFSDYISNYESLSKVVQAAEAALPEDAKAKGKVFSGFVSFTKSGSQSPFTASLQLLRNVNMTPDGKARAALAIFAGFPSLDNADQALGLHLKALPGGFGMTSSETDRQKVNAAIGDPVDFVKKILAMASFDVAGETRRALGQGAQAPAGAAPAAAAPVVPVVPGAKPPIGSKGAKSWDEYVKATKMGQTVKSAWDRYALASVPPINPNDFSLFTKWWSDYKRSNPSWGGSPVETVAALGTQAKARRAAPL